MVLWQDRGRSVKAIGGFVVEVAWPRSLDSFLGRLLGALAMLALARHAFHFGLSAAAFEIFQAYDAVLRVLLGWLDPMLRPWIIAMFSAVGLHVDFNEYWRHVFVVVQMLFVRDAGVALAKSRRVTATVRLVVGTVIAVMISVLAAIRFDQAPYVVQNLWIATLPTVGIYVYDVVMYLYSSSFDLEQVNAADNTPNRIGREFLKPAFTRARMRLALGLVITYSSFLLPVVFLASVPAGGLIAVGFATVANAAYWLWRGGRAATLEAHHGGDWMAAFRASEAGRFGAAVSGVLVWAAIFGALNAGMKQLGL